VLAGAFDHEAEYALQFPVLDLDDGVVDRREVSSLCVRWQVDGQADQLDPGLHGGSCVMEAACMIAREHEHSIELEAQVSQLQAQVIELQQRVNETEILAALVDFSRSNPESTYKAASVIGRDPSPFLHYIIINRGSNDDIRRGMPVVTNQGLVGRVDSVIADAARVELITDPASSINVYLQNAETDAVLFGSVTGDVSLDMISQDVSVEAGDLILTSGLSGGYPSDLPIGQVVTMRSLEFELLIYDFMGKLVYSANIGKGAFTPFGVECSEFANGIYYWQIKTASGISTGKFMKVE
jgi:hypothetical protein